ncbi:hypothetical protein ACW5R3_01610 [Bizionia sp. KMM 8389]
MRALIYITIFCLYMPISAQNYTPEHHGDIEISYVPITELQNQIYNSKNTIKVVYFYSNNCSATLEFNPIINNFYLKNKDKFELFVISREPKKNLEKLYNYLFYEGLYFPVYMTDKKSLSTNIKTLCSDCNENIMGESSFYILDAHNNLLAQSNYNLTVAEKKQLLTTYIK